MKETTFDALTRENVIDIFAKDWMLVTAGTLSGAAGSAAAAASSTASAAAPASSAASAAAAASDAASAAGGALPYNTMTASWGGIGYLWNRPVAFVFVRPERYTHDFIEREERLTLSFYGEEWRKALQLCGTRSGRELDKSAATGLVPEQLPSGAVTFAQSRLTLDCRKLFKTEMTPEAFLDASILDRWYGPVRGGLHTIYVVEIEKVYI